MPKKPSVGLSINASPQWLRPAAVNIPGLYLWKMDNEAPGNSHLTFIEFDSTGVAWAHAWDGQRQQRLVAPATKNSSKLFGPIPGDGSEKKYGWRRQIGLAVPTRRSKT